MVVLRWMLKFQSVRRNLAALGVDSTWMEDCLVAHSATSMGLDFIAAWRGTGPYLVVLYKAVVVKRVVNE